VPVQTTPSGINGVLYLVTDIDSVLKLTLLAARDTALASLDYMLCPGNDKNNTFALTGSQSQRPVFTPVSSFPPSVKLTKNPTPPATQRPTKKPTPPPIQTPTKIPTPPPTQKPTKKPTPRPINKPTTMPISFPSSKPTAKPTLVPSFAPTKRPTLAPSTKPTAVTTAASCPYLTLDFNKGVLQGDYVTDQLKTIYGVTISAVANKGGYTPGGAARVFDTSKPGSEAGMGSPNKSCGGPGIGVGGQKGSLYENCAPRGNVVIVQKSDVVTPASSQFGGSVIFDFDSPVYIRKIVILDSDGSKAISLTVSTQNPPKKARSTCANYTFQLVSTGNAIKRTGVEECREAYWS
jgi:hypothetical protein